MESAYFRYGEDRKTSSSVYKTIQIALLGFASALVLMLWLGKPLFMPLMSLAESHAEIYLLMLGILWFDTLSIVPFAELRSEEHTSELQSRGHLVCRLLLEKKKICH